MLNFGGGNLNWTASASHPWIDLPQPDGAENDSLVIKPDPAGLAPGVYTGRVTVFSLSAVQAPGSPAALQETVTIPVNLVILPAKQIQFYLPTVRR